MDQLRVPLSAIAPSGAVVDVVVPTADLRPEGVEEILPGMIAVKGVMSEAGRDYVFLGTVSGSFQVTCDRCLEAADCTFEAEVCWAFAERVTPEGSDAEPDDDDDTPVCAFTGKEVDLAPNVWEEVVLAAPAKSLCRPDCAGLCPHCGANWNRGRCDCRETEELDRKGLAGLASLFPNLKPDHPEE